MLIFPLWAALRFWGFIGLYGTLCLLRDASHINRIFLSCLLAKLPHVDNGSLIIFERQLEMHEKIISNVTVYLIREG